MANANQRAVREPIGVREPLNKSVVVNQEVFNIKLDWSILCPFKVVAYTMKAAPQEVTIITVRPSYLLKQDRHKKAEKIGKRMGQRIINAIKAGVSP